MRTKGIAFLLLLAGVSLAVTTYAVLYLVVKQGPVYDFMCGRGLYQHVSTILLFYGLMLVTYRWSAFKPELRSLRMEIPTMRISPEDAEKFAERVPAEYRDTIFGRRIAEALRGYARHEDVGPLMDRLAQNDREHMERSASLLSWVRSMPPVLGLLGTLDGLRGGTSEIATISGADSLDKMRSALQRFALSSSTAFDCTLMGIICALVLSMFIFFLRKREDGHLATVDSIAHNLSRYFQRVSAIEEEFRQVAHGFMTGFLNRLEDTLASTTKHMVESFDQEMRHGMTLVAEGWLERWHAELTRTSASVLDQVRGEAGENRAKVSSDGDSAGNGAQAQGAGE